MAAFFGADKDKVRQELRNQYHSDVEAWRTDAVNRRVLEEIVEELRSCEKPLLPMHWEIEFPEVFERENPGFDAIVGNPPFLGGKRISGALGSTYKAWLADLHDCSSGNADLVSHFFRRVFGKLRSNGTSGLVATNTVSQGDTRQTGLAWIGLHGGEFFQVWPRHPWPGRAAVVVSVIWLQKGRYSGHRILNDRRVQIITAFLFDGGGHTDPYKLYDNSGQSFIGCDVKGQGFLFADNDSGSTSLSRMGEMLSEYPACKEVLQPYIGGAEINTSPTQEHHRWVINFGERSLAEARAWEPLLTIVERKVRPERMDQGRRAKGMAMVAVLAGPKTVVPGVLWAFSGSRRCADGECLGVFIFRIAQGV